MPNIDFERVNWENGANTPLNDINLNKSDRALDEVVKYINKTNTYSIETYSWQSTGNPIYPYKARIYANGIYSNSDIPIAQVFGMNDIETQEEITSMSYVTKVIVDAQGIDVYAKDQPTVKLKLVLKL